MTRYYFPSSGTPDISPAFGTGWNRTTGAQRFNLVSAKIGSAKSDRSVTSTATSPEFHLSHQYVGPALAAQTLTGTCKGVISCFENNAAFNGTLALVVRVVSSDGTHLAFLTNGATDVPVASEDNATSPPEFVADVSPGRRAVFETSAAATDVPLTDFACDAGDRIVVEIGVRDVDTGTARSGRVRVGDNNAADLTYGTGVHGDEDAWIEFTQTIEVQGAAASTTGSAAWQSVVIASSNS